MTVAVHPGDLIASKRLPRTQTSRRLRLGMPQLGLEGLSETWLLKEAGDIHWHMIADLAGRERPEFRDEAGELAYAAFCAASSDGLALDLLREHDELAVSSTLRQVSRTRFASRHTLMREGELLGTLDLLSVFVRRESAGRNRTIARARLPEFSIVDREPVATPIADLSARLRKADWDEHRGFRREDVPTGPSVRVRPCPSQDFNGAGFLYFVAYQAFADRAEWELMDLPVRGVSTLSRDIVYRGNIEPGEVLRITLRGSRRERGRVEHWMTIAAECDGRSLADVFTTKRCD